MGASHISVMASKNPSLILLVPYDTPSISYDKSMTYYLNDSNYIINRKKKSIRNKTIIEMIQIFLIAIFSYLTFKSVTFFKYIGIVIILLLVVYFLLSRKEKSYTANMNFNSASIALALSIMNDVKGVSIIFIDDYYKNVKWKDFLKSKNIDSKDNIILLESIAGDGDLFISKSHNDLFNYSQKFNELETDEFYSIINRANKDEIGLRVDLKSFNKDYEVDVEILQLVERELKRRVEENI